MKHHLFDAPGPLARRNARAIGTLFILLCAGAAWLVLRRFSHAGMLSADVWAVLLNTDLQKLLAQGLMATFQVGLSVSTFWSLVAGIVLYNSAVIAVIVSAGIQALPPGQAEAGAAIGLRRHEIFTAIQLPQAVRSMLPALISQMVVLLKETSLGFIVGYTEFLRNARTAVEYLGNSYSLPIYTMMAVVYIVINCLLSRAATLAQKNA